MRFERAVLVEKRVIDDGDGERAHGIRTLAPLVPRTKWPSFAEGSLSRGPG
jgi:hypothetical protein